MKPALSLAKDIFRNLKPCVHGADTFEAADKTGFKREEILDFSSSVNPLGASGKALEAIKNNLNLIPSYPDSTSTNLRNAISSHFSGVTKNNVVVGNGSTELIYLFADAFMQKGDAAIVPAPSFSEYENAVRKTGATVKYAKLNKSFQADPASFIRKMSKKVKVLYFCNPNNPTSILTSIETIKEITQEALERNILVFLDEDFLEFVENGEEFSMIHNIKDFPNLFVLRSFTKIFGLTGLRVGYGIASEEITSILLNSKIPWNVNCLGQVAAVAALEDENHLKKTLELVKEEKSFILDGLRRFKVFKIYPPDANFFFVDTRKSGYRAVELKEKMLNRGILIRDCSSFAGLDEYFIRIAVKTRQENEKLLEALRESIA
jgi:threonine-phosphate decarboxylase